MRYIVTNFAYGTGPYLRASNLAIAFNGYLERSAGFRCGIIVPLVYGEKQKRIMLEEFGEHDRKFPEEILLDEKLGGILRGVFYADSSYDEALARWVRDYQLSSDAANEHLSGEMLVETLSGETRRINGRDIIVELSRSPRIRYGAAPSYFSSFAYIEEILERTLKEPVSAIKADRFVVKDGIRIARKAEEGHRIYALAHPATFSFDPQKGRYHSEIDVPPLVPPPVPNNDDIQTGIYVTITGIPGLERLYADAKRLGVQLYSNDPEAVPGAVYASPRVITNKNIIFQFARSGWSSVWTSMLGGTPIVVPEYDNEDDPEIYFNNRSIEALKIGFVWRGERLEDIMSAADVLKKSCKKMSNEILDKWGTVDGNDYSARIFADDFVKNVL